VRSSAASILCHRCFPDRHNPRSTSAGTPRADPRGSEAWSRRALTSPTSTNRPRRSDLAANHPALSLRPIQALGEHQHVPLVLCARCGRPLALSWTGTPHAGEGPPREWSPASNRRRSDPPIPLNCPIRVQCAGLDLGQVGVQIVGSRFDGLRPKIPVSARAFAKESLYFLGINPQSIPVQKKFQIGPSFYAEAPELSRNRVRFP
jgi:hypothetical protein